MALAGFHLVNTFKHFSQCFVKLLGIRELESVFVFIVGLGGAADLLAGFLESGSGFGGGTVPNILLADVQYL
jgi:hypothetical protein